MSITLSTAIGAIIILAFILLAIFIQFKFKKSTKSKNDALDFLNGLADTFYEKMLEIISNIDLSKYSSLEEAEADIITQVYDCIWDYVNETLKDEKNIISISVLKIINKDFVIKFINSLMETKNLSEQIKNLWVTNQIETAKSVFEDSVKEDEEKQKQFSDSSKYNDTFDESDLDPVSNTEIDEKELEKLNPPKDEEEDYNPETDESVEVIPEEESFFFDKNGRKRDKSTGRFV